MRGPQIIVMAKHRPTGQFEMLAFDNAPVTTAIPCKFPENEYDYIILSLDEEFAKSIIAHGTVEKTVGSISEAREYIEKHFEAGFGRYPSKRELHNNPPNIPSPPPPQVDAYQPDKG